MVMKVSAIVTTHNRSKLALKAIESILNQTYKSIEIVVVDDASKEEHVRELEMHAERMNYKYIYIDQMHTRGGNYARNVGIKESKGEYIAFLDDDDEWFTTKIEKQVQYLDLNKEIDFVACGKVYEVDFGKEIFEDDVEALPTGNMQDYIIYNIPYTTSSIMLRRSIIETVGFFDEHLKYWQEYELEMRLANVTAFGVIRENLVLYRIVKNDYQRLTNKLDGWDESVAYINDKHKDIIKEKSWKIQRQRKYLIAKDGINRAVNASVSKRKYLFMLWKVKPSPFNFIKIIFNVARLREIRFIDVILNMKGSNKESFRRK